MAEPIGFQTGLDAALLRETELHPAYKVAWEKRTATLKRLVDGHNEFEKRLKALEEAGGSPLPVAGSGVLFVAWGLANGQFTPSSLSDLAIRYGFGGVALEYDDFDNAARWASFKAGVEAKGLRAGVWFTEGGNIGRTPDDASFVLPEVESPNDYYGLLDAIDANEVPDIERLVVTNFGGIIVKDYNGVTNIPASKARAKVLIDAGFGLMTECYIGDDPNMTPPAQEFIGVSQLGWSKAYPCFGVYGAASWDTYQPWHNVPGRSVYLAEYLR